MSPLHTTARFVCLRLEGMRGKTALVLTALPVFSVPAHLRFSFN